jgi:hypothetical protein
MEGKKLHKVGKYGTEETCRDENYSIECAREVFQYLKLHEPIKGWRYMIIEDGIPETMYYKRDGVPIPEGFGVHKICPDIPTIILSNVDNPDDFYTVLSGDDKYQETNGNAIERSNKNHRGVFEEKMCYNSSINPYVILCSGSAFFDEDGVTPNDYFESKFRQMFPYTKNGKPYIWSRNDPHNSSKQMWNQLYLQRERFTKEQKLDILKSVAMQSVKYYRSFLEN